MFINFWYAATRGDELTDSPLKRRMLGQDFVLFRDAQGQAHCLSNTCVHRGGSLAGGKVTGDCIQCPYHGWQFAGDGSCQKIPSMGADARIPGRARVDSYPTLERYGLVFCFLGDLPEADRPPIMDIPEFGQEGWRATTQYFEWDIDYKRSIENGLDPAHNEFVHPTHGFSGERDDYKLESRELIETEYGAGIYGERLAPPLKDKKMREASGRDKDAIISGGTGHHGVSSVWTHIHPTPEMKIHQYLFETPIDEEHTSLFLVNTRNFLLEPSDDERMMERNQVVALQDRDVLMDLQPKLTPARRNREFFLEPDACAKRYREFLDEWQSRGWRIDVEKVNRTRRKVAYAIPSPDRRHRKGWILDAIPLMTAAEAGARQHVAGE